MSIHNFAPASNDFGAASGRQQRIEAFVEAAFSDLVSGEDYAAIWIPPGACDIQGNVVPIVVFNSATSDVIDVGSTSSENAYKNDGSLAALTVLPLTALPVTSTGFWMTFRWVGVGTAPTTGKFRLYVTYILEGRSQFDHGETIYTA